MRRIGTVEDIAAAILYLASPASSYVTGQILAVDGGLLTSNFTMPFPTFRPITCGSSAGGAAPTTISGSTEASTSLVDIGNGQSLSVTCQGEGRRP